MSLFTEEEKKQMDQFIIGFLLVAASSVYKQGLKKISQKELDGQYDLEIGFDAIEALESAEG